MWLELEMKTPVMLPGYVTGTFTESGKSVTKLILVGGLATNGQLTT